VRREGRRERASVAGAALVTAAALLLGLATASGPFFVSAAGTALLETELAAAGDGGSVSLLTVQATGLFDPEVLRTLDTGVREELAAQELPAPVHQVVAEVTAGGDPTVRTTLLGREGAASHLPPVVEDAVGDLAATVVDAGRLRVGPGAELELHGVADRSRTVRVGPLVDAFDRGDMPAFWRPVTGLLTGVDDPRFPPPPPALLGEPEDVLGLLNQLGVVEDGVATMPVAVASWTVPLEGAPTLEQARELGPRIAAVRTQVVDPTTELGQRFVAGGSPPSISGQQLDTALTEVESATAALAVPVRLLGWAGQVLALGAVAAAAVIARRRQLARGPLWAARGVPPAVLGARHAAAAVIPTVVGVAVGWWTAGVGVQVAGPGGAVDASVLRSVLGELAVVAVVAVLLVGIVTAVASSAVARTERQPRRVPPVAEALAVVLLGLALWQADTRRQTTTVDVDGVVQLDPLTVALPLLVVATVAMVGTRALGLLLRSGLGHGARRGVWYLASRRLRAVGGATLGLVALAATSIGLLVLATTLRASAEATVDDQVGVLLGADAVVPLSRAEGVAGTVDPTTLPFPATRVRRAPGSLLDGRHAVDVLLVDPATFAQVAYRPRHLADVDVDALLGHLDDPTRAADLPAIVVGASYPGSHRLTVGSVDLEVAQVATAPVFPGVAGERPTLVLADGDALAPEDPTVASRLAIVVYPELWVTAGAAGPHELRASLADVVLQSSGSGPGSVGVRTFEFADDRRQDPGLVPARWTFVYLQAQAVALAALGVLALVGHHRARQRDQVLASALAGRMGLSAGARSRADALELTILLGVAVGLGAAAGLVAARTVLVDYDPLPEVLLPVVFAPPVALLPGVVLAIVGLAAGTLLWSRRTLAHADVAALLRSGT
jgi:putative ABC transport system permease protein